MRRVLLLLTLITPLFAACGDDADSEARGPDVTVADLNVLHGLFCPRETENCRLADRIDLLFQWIAGSGCPDVVTLQEGTVPVAELVAARAGSACPFPYEVVLGPHPRGIDDEIVLTRYPVSQVEQRSLHPSFRHVLHVRVDHPVGPVDVFATHLASGGDGALVPCSGTGIPCPPECIAANAGTVRDCQAVQVADFVIARHNVTMPAVITGDFNDTPGSFVYQQFVGRGWTDVYLAAGNPECDPTTGVGCTSGRNDIALDQFESPVSNEIERIDYIFLVPPAPGSSCTGSIDSQGDADGDGIATRIFADDPNPFAPSCGPLPDPICWPSDHEGVQLDLNCGG